MQVPLNFGYLHCVDYFTSSVVPRTAYQEQKISGRPAI